MSICSCISIIFSNQHCLYRMLAIAVNQKYALQGLEIGFVSKNTVILHVVL